MKILFVYADTPGEWNCSQHNCVNPTNAINKTGVHHADYIFMNDFIANEPPTQKLCFEADVIIIERNLFQDTLPMMMFWKSRGKSIGIIFDDGYHIMHQKNPAFAFWTHGELRFEDKNHNQKIAHINPKPLQQMTWGMEMSKGLQTVSQEICDAWKAVTPTYLVHNHLVMEDYLDIKPLHPHDPSEIWIGWTGSLSHRDSFESSGLLRAYRKITKRFPNVKVLITGDKMTYDNVDVPAGRKMYSGFVPREYYPALVKSLDICTIPLFGAYDKCRSQIKVVEAMAVKTPVLATDFPNYTHLKPYTNFTDNGWEAWEEKLAEMITNLSYYKQHAIEVGYPFALTQNIDYHVQERIDVYQKMIDTPYTNRMDYFKDLPE